MRAQRAAQINQAQDLSRVRVDLHDEIFQGNQSVLAGIDAASTFCDLLQGVAQRDADTGARACWMPPSKCSTPTTRWPMRAPGFAPA